MFLSAIQVNGDLVNLVRNHTGHLNPPGIKQTDTSVEKSFGELLSGAFGEVNDKQILAQELSRQMITDPDSVNVHDVTIAIGTASMVLSMTKSVVDGALQAYKEIVSLR